VTGIAFHYRQRRGGNGKKQAAAIGQRITLPEGVEHLIELPAAPSAVALERLEELGFEPLTPEVGVLAFGNFVGTTNIAGVIVDIISTKIGPDGVSGLLQDISAQASSLIFGWRSPTHFGAATTTSHHSPVPYHQFQFLRHIMLEMPSGQRLQDHFATVERNPTRRFLGERPVVRLDRVRRLDARAIQMIAARSDRIVRVPSGSPLVDHPLAVALEMGTPPQQHFPNRIAAPRGRLSFDTPENRFVRHFLGEAIGLVQRFVDHPKIHRSLRRDCRTMLSVLEPLATAPFLSEVGQLVALSAPTQALAKADGYKHLLDTWLELSAHQSLPASTAETTRLLEGRDMARLYEFWVFLQVLKAAFEVTGASRPGRPNVRRTELGEILEVGLSTTVAPGLTVTFNPTYTRSSGSAYSTPLRPDVIVELDGQRHAFDAKYRLQRLDLAEDDADDDPSTFKRADLYKMHTYRDAIAGLRSAFIVYPGSEFAFFERNGNRRTTAGAINNFDGVGALPARPADANPARALIEVLSALLTPGAVP
jgi:hypothetical protein